MPRFDRDVHHTGTAKPKKATFEEIECLVESQFGPTYKHGSVSSWHWRLPEESVYTGEIVAEAWQEWWQKHSLWYYRLKEVEQNGK